tara:strand:- start:1652 stop:2413 length:762 start_codon:yes stop_codon:yes gene_type:complete
MISTPLIEVEEGRGFFSLPAIENDIILKIKSFIDEDLKNRVALYSKDAGLTLGDKSFIENYHLFENSFWFSFFNKKHRSLSKDHSIFLNNYFCPYLTKNLSRNIEISDDLNLGYPCFSFRIVRPNVPLDIGPLHADQWFIDIGATPNRVPKQPSKLIKFWIPLQSHSTLSNLIVVPRSHHNIQDYKYKAVETSNGIKPVINSEVLEKDTYMINNQIGEPVIFNMSLIHGGAINLSEKCRVSLEFEFFASNKHI